MSRITGALAYVVWITWQVITLSVHLGRDVFTPGLDITPRIVRLPLRCTSDLEVTLMTSSITITPGTLVLGIAPRTEEEPTTVFVQALYGRDEDAVLAGLHEMERRLLRATRGRTPSESEEAGT